MPIQRTTRADFAQIVTDIADFWGSERTLRLHHPSLIYEFGDTAFVIREGERVTAYLFGYLAQTGPTAYVHLVGVRAAYRGQGLGRQLYAHFIDVARARGCTALKAITTPTNQASIAFHTRLGMTLRGEPNADGVPVIRDYSGPGQDRVVFHLDI